MSMATKVHTNDVRPRTPFKLRSNLIPKGDQPQAIKELLEGLEAGRKHQTLLGVTGSGKTFTIANVVAQYGRPVLVISHNKTLAAQLYGELKAFFPEKVFQLPRGKIRASYSGGDHHLGGGSIRRRGEGLSSPSTGGNHGGDQLAISYAQPVSILGRCPSSRPAAIRKGNPSEGNFFRGEGLQVRAHIQPRG